MPTNIDDMVIGAKHDPALVSGPDMNHRKGSVAHETELPAVYEGQKTLLSDIIGDDFPTEEEMLTLPRISDPIPWKVYTVAFVELCERFSYYGTTVVYQNFIQRPIPKGSTTGAVPDAANHLNTSPGVLNMGQRAATGLTTMNQFWVYLIPLFSAYIADAHWGRYKTIMVSIFIAIAGHIILVASAAPGVITNQGGSLAAFLIGMLVMGLGTGGFKPNISPLVAEQVPATRMRVTTDKNGRKVIVDPAITYSRIYNYFYLFINIGALVGQIGMSYAERFVGFWLAFLLPTLLFLTCPAVLFFCKKRYKLTPPQGSVLGKAFKLFALANKGKWKLNPVSCWKSLHNGNFWEDVKPSKFTDETRPKWMTFDDAWAGEVARGFRACEVFLWLPLYWLTYNQLNNNLTSQAGTMTLNGIPNDVLSNLDPFALIILIPIFDLFIYPGLRKMGIRFTPIKKIAFGFYTGTAAMIWAAVLQQYIYWQSPCGYSASTCAIDTTTGLPSASGDGDAVVVGINVWAQTGAYILIAVSEIFASIVSLEYAFSKAPKNMRSLVMSVNLFMSAFASAIGTAFVYLANDPLLIWNYTSAAILAGVGGIAFWLRYAKLDAQEDELNNLPTGHLVSSREAALIEQGRAESDSDIEKRGDLEKGAVHTVA